MAIAGPAFTPDVGVAAMTAAQNPDAFAQIAAASGMVPPDPNAGFGQKFAAMLAPMTGIKKPEAVAPPSYSAPGAPAAPQPSQAINPESALMQLILKGAAPQTAQPNLAQLLGR